MPTPQKFRAEYARRINRVIDHIDRHLDEPLDLPSLAEIANFSAFHFHRIFAAWMGETLGDYIQRRRLEVGALYLAGNPEATVLSAALSTGFASGEAFARAFKQRFACSPSTWRADTPQRWALELAAKSPSHRHSNLDQALSNPDQAGRWRMQDHSDIDQATMELQMDISLRELPAVKIAYIRHIGPYGLAVNTFWKDIFFPWVRAHGLEGRPMYGIGHDDPSITPPDKCRYDACVAVPDDFMASGVAGLATLPGGRYAIKPFEGTLHDITGAWTEVFRGWLPGSGFQCDAKPCFEYYPPNARFDPVTGVFACDICIPVRPL